MNHLYEAIIGLGRSWEKIKEGRWIRGGLGHRGDFMCAVGIMSKQIVGAPVYLTNWAEVENVLDLPPAYSPMRPVFRSAFPKREEQNAILWIMADALRNCVTEGMLAKAIANTNVSGHQSCMREAAAGSSDISDIQQLLVHVNDTLDWKEEAAAWFSDAIDLLVDQLLPAMPNYRYCEACQQGLGWDGMTEHVEGCPDRAPVLV